MKNLLNKEQIQAIEHGDGPLMIIAGAGTGKTTVVTERIKFLLASGMAKPTEILALTFTEKASREMEARVDEALPYGVTQLWISTFHAFCDRVIKSEGIHIGLNPGFTLLSEAETMLFFRNHLYEFDLEYFRPLGNPFKFIGGMISHFSRLKDEDISPKQYVEWVTKASSDRHQAEEEEISEREKFTELARAYQTYENLKVKEGIADYGDLIFNTLKIFRERKNVLVNYQHQFKYILIDEFQDTNYSQNQLAIFLAGKRKNITVVGDDDQAIYRFRGAAISNMVQFRHNFPGHTVVTLTKNYRSTKEILDRSYDMIQQNNPDRLEIAENIDKKLESMRRKNGEKVHVIVADRVENEAEEVIKTILEKRKQDPEISWNDFAILVRANNHSEPFVRALERNGIPYQFLGPGQLFRQSEIKDLIAYLKVLAHFDDTVAMYRVLTMPWVDVSGRDIAVLLNTAKKMSVSLFEVCEMVVSGAVMEEFRLEDAESVQKVEKIIALLHKHLELMKKETAGQILYYFLEESGLLKKFTHYESSGDEKIAGNIAKFFDKLKTYEIEHEDSSVFAIVDWINLSMELGESPLASNTDWSENNAVHILTVHSAKGLEFPYVFVVNLVSQRFPSTQRREQIPIPDDFIHEILPEGDFHLQEERRLFYVAMTRARDGLYLTAAKYYGDGKREKKISPFISEAVGTEAVTYALEHEVGSTKQLSLLSDWALSGEGSHEEIQKESVKQSIHYLSYSQLESFSTCPLQYKYRYILKIPVPPSAALIFGDTMHKTIHAFYQLAREGKNPTMQNLLNLYDGLWNSVGFGNKEYEKKMKTHGIALLTGFYEKGYEPNNIPKELELPFRLRITPTLKLGGKIDRIDSLHDGKIEIIDYKTGKSTKVKDVTKDMQLSVYAMAATDQGVYSHRPEDVIVSFYFFESQEKISGTRTREQIENTRQEIEKKAHEIEVSTFQPTPGKHCDFCEFRLICEAWQ